MIEFALLFALGFLAAALLGLLLAPFVHRRVVRFAEDRLKATTPLSPQEVRAQKDAARAVYAAENARTAQTLKRERDKSISLMLDKEKGMRDIQRLAGENADLHSQLADMNVEAADLRSSIRQYEMNLERLTATFTALEADNIAKIENIRTLTRQLDRVSADIDSLRIDLATRETEAENLKSRIAGLRDERDSFRDEAKNETGRAREMEVRLNREGSRIRQLESRLAREMSALADKDTALERRAGEIEKLKARVKETGNELKEASRALRIAGTPPRKDRKIALADVPSLQSPLSPDDTQKQDAMALELAGETRNRATALVERLTNSRTDAHDPALREEMAGIAAAMIAVTVAKEGDASPIPAILATDEPAEKDTGKKSLADRARDILSPN